MKETSQNTVSVDQASDIIKQLIAENNGDIPRLQYIHEFLDKGRHLYASDQNYLEKKINATIIYEERKPPSPQQETLKKIQKLLRHSIGDSERLKFMLTWVAKRKTLLKSDQLYLNEKVSFLMRQKTAGKEPARRSILDMYPLEVIIDLEQQQDPSSQAVTPYSIIHVTQLKSELESAEKMINKLQLDIATLKGTINNLRMSENKE